MYYYIWFMMFTSESSDRIELVLTDLVLSIYETNKQFFIFDRIKTTIQFFLFTDDHISFSIAFDVYLLHYTPVTTPNLSNNISGILIKSVVYPSLFNVFRASIWIQVPFKPISRWDELIFWLGSSPWLTG